MNWLVTLTGDNSLLDSMPKIFNSSNLKIDIFEEEYVISSDEFEKHNNHETNREIAEILLTRVKGILKLRGQKSSQLNIGSVIHLKENGIKETQAVFFAKFKLRTECKSQIVDKYGNRIDLEVDNLSQKLLNFAPGNSLIDDVLRFYIKEGNDLNNFYKVFEIIRDDLKAKGNSIGNMNWFSKNELSNFTSTINNPKASGDNARHAVSKNKPPPRPLSFAQCNIFVKNLILNWTIFLNQEIEN